MAILIEIYRGNSIGSAEALHPRSWGGDGRGIDEWKVVGYGRYSPRLFSQAAVFIPRGYSFGHACEVRLLSVPRCFL